MNTEVDLVLIHPPYHRRLGSGTVFPIGLVRLGSDLRKPFNRKWLLSLTGALGGLAAYFDPVVLASKRPWLAGAIARA